MTERSSTRHVRTDTSCDGAFPPELKVPNAQTRAAMAEAEEILSAGKTRFASADEMFAALERKDR